MFIKREFQLIFLRLAQIITSTKQPPKLTTKHQCRAAIKKPDLVLLRKQYYSTIEVLTSLN